MEQLKLTKRFQLLNDLYVWKKELEEQILNGEYKNRIKLQKKLIAIDKVIDNVRNRLWHRG